MTGYPLDMVENEIHRLRIQGELFRPDAVRVLGEIGGLRDARVLDLCCGVGGITDCLRDVVGPGGEVIGLDFDPVKLEAARAWAAAHDVTFVEGDAFDPPFASESFDLVHTRFAMGIIPGGARLLDVALRLLKPGGVLFVEEAFPEPYSCHPPHPAFDAGKAAVIACFQQIGSTPTLGLALPGMFADAGVEDGRFQPRSHLILPGDPMMDHVGLTLDALRATIIDLGLMTGLQLDQTIADVRAHLDRPGSAMLSFTMVQATGRKPG